MNESIGRIKYRATLQYPLPDSRVPTTACYTLGWVDASSWGQLDAAIMEHIQNTIPSQGHITIDVFVSQAIEPENGGCWVPLQEQIFRAWHDAEGYHYANMGCEVLPEELRGGILPTLFPRFFNDGPGRKV